MSLNHRIRLFLVFLVLIIWLVLFSRYFVIWGTKIVHLNFSNNNAQVTISPYDRVGEKFCEDYDCFMQFRKEPIYFNVWAPAEFETGEMRVEYQLLNQEQLIFSVPKNMNNQASEQFVLYDDYLQELFASQEYEVVSRDDLYLFQKEKQFDDVDSFIENIPLASKLAVYNYDLPTASDSYQVAIEEDLKITPYLQGAHKFLIYIDEIADEDSLIFSFEDLKIRNKENEIVVNVRDSSNKIICTTNLKDVVTVKEEEDVESVNEGDRVNFEFVLEKEKLEVGEYWIEVIASNDIILTELKSSWPLLIKDYVRFASLTDLEILSEDYEFQKQELYTNSQNIKYQVYKQADTQQVFINDRARHLASALKIYQTYFNANDEKKILINHSGLYLQTADYISFSESLNWKTQVVNMQNVKDKKEIDFDYLIVKYNKPKLNDVGWWENTVKFDLQKESVRRNQLIFSFKMPELEFSHAKLNITDFYLKLKK